MSDHALSRFVPAAAPLGVLWRDVLGQLRRDGWLYAIVAGQVLAALVLALVIGRPDKLAYLNAAPIWLRGMAMIAAFYILLVEVPASIRANPGSPLRRLRERVPDLLDARVLAGAVLVLALILSNGAFTSTKSMLPNLTAFHWDARMADWDAWLHGGHDPWVLIQPLLGHQAITRAIQYVYTGGWLVFLCAMLALFAVSRRLGHLRLRFFLTYLFCWIVLGNLGAGIFMSAGPVYFGEVTGDHARFAAQLSYLSFSEGLPHSSYDIQKVLWSLYETDRAALGSGISAFPSLHVAMATLLALAGWKVDRRLGWLGVAFVIVIQLGSVHLAWHYAIDGYASMLATAAVWFGLGKLGAKRALGVRPPA